MHRPLLAASVGLALLALLAPVAARATLLPDSTSLESFRLANGLEVRVRNVPGAFGYAVSIAYGAGALDVPGSDPALARLLAELQLTAAAGDIPERTREDIDSQRPAGWELRVTDHLAVLTDLATPQQFPGVLLQAATRARGVTVSDSCFRTARASVLRQLAQEAVGDPDLALQYRVHAMARGVDDATILANARGKSLEGVDAAAAGALLRRLYVPANAALALVGDFSRQPARALVEQLFGPIPGGERATEAPVPPLAPGLRTSFLPGINAPVSVIAAFPPALEDTLHPACYLASLVSAGWWRDHSGRPRPPLPSAFRYSPVDEPDLVRYFLSGAPAATTAEAARNVWLANMQGLREQVLQADAYRSVRGTVDWLIGGPMPPAILAMARGQLAPLSPLAIGTAMRARWKGDAFWDAYRQRFMTTRVAPIRMYDWLTAPGHSATLTLAPRP